MEMRAAELGGVLIQDKRALPNELVLGTLHDELRHSDRVRRGGDGTPSAQALPSALALPPVPTLAPARHLFASGPLPLDLTTGPQGHHHIRAGGAGG